MDVTAVIPTRGRPRELQRTLEALSGLAGDGEVVIVDNASDEPVRAPRRLGNGWLVRLLRNEENAWAAARNRAAQVALGRWLLMLDDDSAPMDDRWLTDLKSTSDDVVAIGAEVLLPDGRHEAGGLPEVIVGCGALVRTAAFLQAGGYDEHFEYYGEETDLCARLFEHGGRVMHTRRFRVLHRRSEVGRDIASIVERLACNEAIVVHRYAPADVYAEEMQVALSRRRAVAERECVVDAFARGLARFDARHADEPRTPLDKDVWDRLTGQAFADRSVAGLPKGRYSVVMPPGPPGKHGERLVWALQAADRWCEDVRDADGIVVGTLAPSAALTAARELDAVYPERPVHAVSPLAASMVDLDDVADG